nr:EOG090X07SU [Eulimnadia texana]
MSEENSKSSGKVGSLALQTKTSQEVALFKTPTIPIRKKKKILDEDVYVQKLESIIQRDFFPDLKKLKVQAEYLEAAESNDVQKMREIYEKYSLGSKSGLSERGSASPATFETPISRLNNDDFETPERTPGSRSGASVKSSKREEDSKESLDEFLAKYTSEDNESFEEIMDEAKRKHRVKYAWLYEAEAKAKEIQQTNLALPTIEKQAIEDKRPAQVETWGYEMKNYIMYVPEGAPLTAEEVIRLQRDKEHIQHGNTRFVKNPFDEDRSQEAVKQAALYQAKLREGHVDVDGKEVKQISTPQVGGFSFVKTPSPAPGVSESPLMTWGEIEGTPFRLDGSDTPLPSAGSGPSFRIQEISSRDKIGLKLAEKVSKQHRDKKEKALRARDLSSPSPLRSSRSISDRIASMSPAARSLATSKLGIRLNTDASLRSSYTPSPRQVARGTPMPHTASTPTPTRNPATPQASSSLTDNLLKIPRDRPKARDFF